MLRYLILILALLATNPAHSQIKKEIWGEFSAADARAVTLDETTARISLFESIAGVTTAVTLGANDFVEVRSVTLGAMPGTITLSIYGGTDDTRSVGESVFRYVSHSIGPTINIKFTVPVFTTMGTYPKVEADITGNVTLYIRGYVYRR